MAGVISPAFVAQMVALGKSLAGPMLATVQHTVWAGQDTFGDPLPSTTIARDAIISDYLHTFRRLDGTEVQSQARITFLENIAIDLEDTLVLPTGDTGEILDISGLVDPRSGRYVTVVTMGRTPIARS